jgi:hypothetical protein
MQIVSAENNQADFLTVALNEVPRRRPHALVPFGIMRVKH